MFMFAGASSYLMPAGSAPTVAPRVSAPQMDANTGMTDPRFPRAGKGVLKDGSTAAIPFAITPEHLLTGPTSDYAGNAGFDPMGLGSAYNMKWMREAELKHGRICMLAFYGYLTVDFGNTWPGAPKVSSLLAHDAAVKNGSMLFLLGVIGIVEVSSGTPAVASPPPCALCALRRTRRRTEQAQSAAEAHGRNRWEQLTAPVAAMAAEAVAAHGALLPTVCGACVRHSRSGTLRSTRC